MTTENWLTLIGIIASGILGYLIKYILDRKAQFSTKNAEIKREMYQDYVDLVIDFFDTSKVAKPTHKTQGEMYAFYKKCVLYASPRVLNVYSDLMQQFYKNPTDENSDVSIHQTRIVLKKMTKVFKYMRKDIGLSNRGLGKDGERLFRAIITDYDEKIKPRRFTTRPIETTETTDQPQTIAVETETTSDTPPQKVVGSTASPKKTKNKKRRKK